MSQKIIFKYEGKTYFVGRDASDLNLIVLPDGRTIAPANGWSETSPPKPRGLQAIPHLFQHLSGNEIAQLFNGALATEITPGVTRVDWLTVHAEEYPQWTEVIYELIASNAFVVIPAQYGWKECDAVDDDLMVLEPGVKGPPATFRIQGDVIRCVNYPGSYMPMSKKEWVEYAKRIATETNPEDEWVLSILSR